MHACMYVCGYAVCMYGTRVCMCTIRTSDSVCLCMHGYFEFLWYLLLYRLEERLAACFRCAGFNYVQLTYLFAGHPCMDLRTRGAGSISSWLGEIAVTLQISTV